MILSEKNVIILLIILLLGLTGCQTPEVPVSAARNERVIQYILAPDLHQDWNVQAKQTCNHAPFLMPTDGYIGYIWKDSFYAGHIHQGLDIFGGQDWGETPVYSACDGYLSRQDDWKSTLVIRIPHDPFDSDRQIWTYYTHMADSVGNSTIVEDFPPGTREVWVPAGTLLGYQGNYSGNPLRPVGVHLHFSIVKDDGEGKISNELLIENTLDPSPYFGMELNRENNSDGIVVCETKP